MTAGWWLRNSSRKAFETWNRLGRWTANWASIAKISAGDARKLSSKLELSNGATELSICIHQISNRL
jgi:hypothetical protein